MSKRSKGDRWERKALDILKEQGYQTFKVTRTAIMIKGRFFQKGNDIFDCFDILAMNKDHIQLISVKANYPSKEHKEMVDKVFCPHNVYKSIWKAQKLNRKEPFKIYRSEVNKNWSK
jgi:hypothetical protein